MSKSHILIFALGIVVGSTITWIFKPADVTIVKEHIITTPELPDASEKQVPLLPDAEPTTDENAPIIESDDAEPADAGTEDAGTVAPEEAPPEFIPEDVQE